MPTLKHCQPFVPRIVPQAFVFSSQCFQDINQEDEVLVQPGCRTDPFTTVLKTLDQVSNCEQKGPNPF